MFFVSRNHEKWSSQNSHSTRDATWQRAIYFSSSAQFSTPLPFPVEPKATHSSFQIQPSWTEFSGFPLPFSPNQFWAVKQTAALVHLKCQTDSPEKNETFQSAVKGAAQARAMQASQSILPTSSEPDLAFLPWVNKKSVWSPYSSNPELLSSIYQTVAIVKVATTMWICAH